MTVRIPFLGDFPRIHILKAGAKLPGHYRGLTGLRRGCTTILISHRFSTVRHADRIVVIDEGEVVESGSHDELMAANGHYRTMFDLQAARFDDQELGEGAAS